MRVFLPATNLILVDRLLSYSINITSEFVKLLSIRAAISLFSLLLLKACSD
jgi:hypothetical protein